MAGNICIAVCAMDPTTLTPTAEVDYLDEDKPIRCQNYVCLSFISPEDVIQNKECFFFHKYLAQFRDGVTALMDNLKSKYPDDAGLIDTVIDNHDFLFGGEPDKLQEDYTFFKTAKGTELDKEYNEKHDFQTSVRGIKVRGVFDTLKEAQTRAEVLKRMGDKFNIYVGQVGCWCPWSPNPDDLENAQYAETQLNTLMKKYKENMLLRDKHYEDRKNAKMEAAMKAAKDAAAQNEASTSTASVVSELENTSDPWLDKKQGTDE